MPASSSSGAASLGDAAARLGGQSQLDGERGQPLLGAVVEVALEPPPLGVGGLDQARAGRARAAAANASRSRHDRGQEQRRERRHRDEELGGEDAVR